MNCCLRSKYHIDSVSALLPHRRSMLLVDGVYLFELDKGIQTFFAIGEDNIFLEQHRESKCINSFVAFECIAQSIGLYSGIKNIVLNRQTEDNKKIGFLVGVSNLVCTKPYIELGQTITIDIENIDDMEQMIKAKGVVCDEDGHKIMEAVVSILLQ